MENAENMSQDAPQEQPAEQPTNMDALYKIANGSNLDDVIKWAENANSRLGKSITLPDNPDAEANRLIQDKLIARGYDVILKPDINDAEAVSQLKQMLGIGKPENYTIPESTDEMQYDQAAAENLIEIASKYDLSQDAYQGILTDLTKVKLQAMAQQQKAQQEGMGKLKDELGYAFDDKVSQAKEWMKVINPDYNTDNATAAEIQGMLRMMAKIGELSAEGQNFSRPLESTRMTPAEAQGKIADVMKRLDETPVSDPRYQSLLKEKSELFKLAYPGDEPSRTAGVGGVSWDT